MSSNLTERVRAARNSGKPGTSLDVANKQAVATARDLLESMSGEFAKALPQHIPAEMYIRAGLTAMQKTPQLLECNPASLLGALMSCAQLGLIPGTKEAALVPFGKTCTLIPQWQGMVKMMFNSGQVDSVVAEFICENDEWAYVPSRRPPDDFYHAPAKTDRGEITHAYAFAWLGNGSRSRVALLTRDDAIYIRNRFSKVYAQAEANGKKNSFWHTDFDAAWRKSAVRRIADWVPTSAEMRWYLANEDGDGITTTFAPPERTQVTAAPKPALAPAPEAAEQARPVVVEQEDARRLTDGEVQELRDMFPPDGEVAEGEITTDEPRAESTMDYGDEELKSARSIMFGYFQTYFPAAERDDILGLLSGFTGQQITGSDQLTLDAITEINDAFDIAVAQAEDDDGGPEIVAARFRDMCSFAAANAAPAPRRVEDVHADGRLL